MSADLIARMVAEGVSAQLIADIAVALARADADREALGARRATEAANSTRYRARGGGDIPGWLRREVLERDRYECCDCGSSERLECDHVIPIAKGGATTLENLQVLCKPCNARKRDRIRKSDERGQLRTNADEARHGGISEVVADTPLSPAPSSPQTPHQPHPHTPARDTRAREADLPEGASPEQWRAFAEMRRRIRKPMTQHAEQLALKKLRKLADDGQPPGAVLDQSTLNGWQDLFPLKDDRNGQRPHHNGSAGNHHPLGRIGAASDRAFGVDS